MILGIKLGNSDYNLGTLMCVSTNINNISAAVVVGVSIDKLTLILVFEIIGLKYSYTLCWVDNLITANLEPLYVMN